MWTKTNASPFRVLFSLSRNININASVPLGPIYLSQLTFHLRQTSNRLCVFSRTRVFFFLSFPRAPATCNNHLPRTLTSSWHPSSANPCCHTVLRQRPYISYRALNRTKSAAFRLFVFNFKVSNSHPLVFLWSASLQAFVAFFVFFLCYPPAPVFQLSPLFLFIALASTLHLHPSIPRLHDQRSCVLCTHTLSLFPLLHSLCPPEPLSWPLASYLVTKKRRQ